MNVENKKETRILIVYDSGTGNTEKMALAVAEGAKKVTSAVTMKGAEETTLEDLLNADGIIIGSPTYYGLMSAKVKGLFDASVKIHGKLSGKVGAAFTSAGGTATGAETTILSIVEGMLVHGMIVQGRAHNKHYGVASVGSPDEKELSLCRELGERTAVLAGRLIL
ncbi:MAG: NAD(P)H-dependent oxidoreductase [Theionarchaea archaeon]|nr:NAD(P)H-dependent oxidoreductase [Theionarchaea archaeon]